MGAKRYKLLPATGTESRAMELYLAGYSDGAIGDLVHMSKSAVRQWRHRMGLPAVGTAHYQRKTEKKQRRYYGRLADYLNVSNPACPVTEGAKYTFRPYCYDRDLGDWAEGVGKVTGTVEQIHEDHRWFLVRYEVKGTILRETFKF